MHFSLLLKVNNDLFSTLLYLCRLPRYAAFIKLQRHFTEQFFSELAHRW